MTKRTLGTGLNELGLNELLSDIKTAPKAELRKFPIDVIQPGKYQPRRDMDHEALQELANSIKAQGIIQPIVVRPIAAHRYEIIAGERRWRAAQLAELYEIPAVVREISDEAAIAMSLIENIQRENLNVIEEAMALQRLIDEFEMTHQEAANAVGKSRTTITNLLRLLALPNDIKTMVEHGDLEMGHARTLLGIDPQLQFQTAQTIISKGLSVRETEKLIQKLQHPSKQKTTAHKDPNIISLQNQLSDKFGARITIDHNSKGMGKLIIHYNSLDELDGIMKLIES